MLRRLCCGAAKPVGFHHPQQHMCRLEQRAPRFHPVVRGLKGLFNDLLQFFGALAPAQPLQTKGDADQQISEVMRLIAGEATDPLRFVVRCSGISSPDRRTGSRIRCAQD